jgi:hypothetical protein
MIRRWLGLIAAEAIVRFSIRAITAAIMLAVAVAAAPVTVVAAGAYAAAARNGWPSRRLLVAAAWCGPMLAAWLAAAVLAPAPHGMWLSVLALPYRSWLAFWHLAAAAELAQAVAVVAPAAIPLGLMAGALAWSLRVWSMESGAGGLSPAAGAVFDQRLWRRQVRAARARITAPGSAPLTMRGDLIVTGAIIRSVGHRRTHVAAIGHQRMRSHQVIIGTTGTGKTSLLLRLWAGFMATGLRRHAAGLGAPPLLVVLDCKGGADARRIADRVRRVLREAGARSTAIWPDEASLSLWSLPPRKLTTTLVDLIEHGTGSAAFYKDVMEALIALAVEAPSGPPGSASDLLGRLDPGWLAAAYAGSGSASDHAMIRSSGRYLTEVALRFRTLFRRLGDGLDGPGEFGDSDAWYCILEGTGEISVAEAQARALVDLLADFALRRPDSREILLAVDEFGAVSRRLPIAELYERARSLGLSVQVTAQSWEGLAATEDERRRICGAAEGGIWLLRTPHPEPVAALAGTRKAVETTRLLRRFPVWSKRGSSRLRDVPVVDSALIRRLDVGQVAYVYRGGVTYMQVRRLVAGPAAVSAPAGAHAAPIAERSRPDAKPEPAALPDISPILDAAFGPGPGASSRSPA